MSPRDHLRRDAWNGCLLSSLKKLGVNETFRRMLRQIMYVINSDDSSRFSLSFDAQRILCDTILCFRSPKVSIHVIAHLVCTAVHPRGSSIASEVKACGGRDWGTTDKQIRGKKEWEVVVGR